MCKSRCLGSYSSIICRGACMVIAIRPDRVSQSGDRSYAEHTVRREMMRVVETALTFTIFNLEHTEWITTSSDLIPRWNKDNIDGDTIVRRDFPSIYPGRNLSLEIFNVYVAGERICVGPIPLIRQLPDRNTIIIGIGIQR